jgi:hypothetical protein
VYSVRAGWRRAVSRVWNPYLFGRLAENPLLRVSLHPPDIEHPAVWRQAMGLVRRSVDGGREPQTYLAWVKARGGPVS